jgi:hypothetical protein
MEYYQEGCYIPAYTDWGYLYYNQLYKYDFTQPIDPNSGLQPTSPTADCDIRVDDGVILYEAWHRSDRNAVTCYKCDQRMSIADFKQLPYLNDGSALANPPLPTIPDPGPPPP